MKIKLKRLKNLQIRQLKYSYDNNSELNLSEENIVSKSELRSIEKEIDLEVNEAVEFALGSNDPDPCELTKYIWAD